MFYKDRFIATDRLIYHLKPLVSEIGDSEIKSNYAGFLSVSAITVYELAIKDIFIDFATKKHLVFGNFVSEYFSKINGRIKLEDLKGHHIKLFGTKYLSNFEKRLKMREQITLIKRKHNITSDYSNLITCRHKYVHNGNPTLSFEEVLENYHIGKEVIHSLYEALNR